MATWHQEKARARNGFHYWHETLWTVLHDPPGKCAGLTRFANRQDAKAYIENRQAKGDKHLILIAPETESY